jgi:hypothetical protein
VRSAALAAHDKKISAAALISQDGMCATAEFGPPADRPRGLFHRRAGESPRLRNAVGGIPSRITIPGDSDPRRALTI